MLLSDINRMLACVPEDVFWRSQNALWSGNDYVEVSDSEYREMMLRYERRQRDDKWLSECVELNNEGILHEKNGDVESAIKAYEQNICPGCWPARYSFDRLLVLYRKKKDYDSERRVCLRAVDEFPEEEKYRQRLLKIDKLIEKHGING